MGFGFEKWEGTGNDFVVVRAADLRRLTPELVRAICDRRRGVGADGVLVVGEAGGRAGSMTVFNADGSRPEMCGNGLRCVAAALGREGEASRLVVATDAGDREARVAWTGPGEAEVEVTMGHVEIGGLLEARSGDRVVRFRQANVGTPHAITFEAVSDDERDRLGPEVERSVAGGTNVEFARVRDAGLDLVVWERGVGYTQACGTGACAAAAVAAEAGLVPPEGPIEVRLPGGSLWILLGRDDKTVSLRGTARRVFEGQWRAARFD